jgi:Spy/CpxP family protein refolding chaperone
VKKNIKILAVIFSIALNIAFLAAYGVRALRDRPKYVYEELDLSKDQQARIEAGRDRFLLALDEIRDKMASAHLEMIDLVAADPADRQSIEAKFEKIREGQRSMQSLVVEHLLEDKRILTADQRTKFFAVLKSRIREQAAPGPAWLPTGAGDRKR